MDQIMIALVTYNDQGKYPGEGTREDQRLKKYLQGKGLAVTYEVWTDPSVRWEAYEAVVLKSPWDYFDQVEAFRRWLDELDNKKVRVLNPTAIVRWNHDKRYLLDLEKAGFGIVPTRILPRHGAFEPERYYEEWATDALIVKPVVSGGAKNTFFIPREAAPTFIPNVETLLKEEAFLVQPFMPQVQAQGEWSLIFFHGHYSHCVRKVPQSGDFRVQHYFGGAIIVATPPVAIREQAQKLVDHFAPDCLYARVDGLADQDRFYLMELELIEPLLYLDEEEARYENYFRALQELLVLENRLRP
jgi:glutathione synthase/RimK-type ligase-like ATP-grasp enzyme